MSVGRVWAPDISFPPPNLGPAGGRLYPGDRHFWGLQGVPPAGAGTRGV